jgi:gamma-glutamyltranspeptidase / glutathione hydrolase
VFFIKSPVPEVKLSSYSLIKPYLYRLMNMFKSTSKTFSFITTLGIAFLLNGCSHLMPQSAPEPGFGSIVSVANPLAAKAGMEVLSRGGTAVDAAVAIQATLSLVEPQSSGLGGGAFIIYYDHKSGKVSQYIGRETAPQSATPDLFLKPDGTSLSYSEAVLSGRSTGVPGVVLTLGQAHKDHGKLKWNSLFKTAEHLATDGFVISPRLGSFLSKGGFPQINAPDYKAYFGSKTTGDLLINKAYANTLKTLASEGPDIFRKGALVEAILSKTHEGPLPGGLEESDFLAYMPEIKDALCAPYRVYIICVPSPPSSGVSLLQALKIIEGFAISEWGVNDARAWQVLLEAQRLIYADRDQYIADDKFISVPVEGLLDQNYVSQRALTITIGQPSPTPRFGLPPKALSFANDQTLDVSGTSHFVIRDQYGNALSMTTTVESLFGSGRMVGGFFLNNQLTDFSFSPKTKEGLSVANSVAGGKRPRSSMAPVIILDKNRQVLGMLGSPGGSSILAYNLKALIGVLDWGLTMQQAINLPNLVARGDTIRIEANRARPELITGLKSMGYKITEVDGENSGLHGVMFKGDIIEGGADPRREGVTLIRP